MLWRRECRFASAVTNARSASNLFDPVRASDPATRLMRVTGNQQLRDKEQSQRAFSFDDKHLPPAAGFHSCAGSGPAGSDGRVHLEIGDSPGALLIWEPVPISARMADTQHLPPRRAQSG